MGPGWRGSRGGILRCRGTPRSCGLPTSTRTGSHQCDARSRWRHRINLPTWLVARRRTVLRERSNGVVAALPFGSFEVRSSDRVVIRNLPDEAEFGRPAWVFGTVTWACAGPSQLIVSYTQRGRWHLATVDAASGMLSPFAPELQPDEWIAADASSAIVVAGSDTAPDRVVRIDLATGEVVSICVPRRRSPIEAGYISVPEAIEFPTADGRTAHAFYYAPQNQDFNAPAGETPPLIAISHGGPTAAASATLDLQIQVLDEPWFRARGRQLRRQLGVRPRLP